MAKAPWISNQCKINIYKLKSKGHKPKHISKELGVSCQSVRDTCKMLNERILKVRKAAQLKASSEGGKPLAIMKNYPFVLLTNKKSFQKELALMDTHQENLAKRREEYRLKKLREKAKKQPAPAPKPGQKPTAIPTTATTTAILLPATTAAKAPAPKLAKDINPYLNKYKRTLNDEAPPGMTFEQLMAQKYGRTSQGTAKKNSATSSRVYGVSATTPATGNQTARVSILAATKAPAVFAKPPTTVRNSHPTAATATATATAATQGRARKAPAVVAQAPKPKRPKATQHDLQNSTMMEDQNTHGRAQPPEQPKHATMTSPQDESKAPCQTDKKDVTKILDSTSRQCTIM